jgi:cell division septum initiation protein DivIVA
MGEDISRPVTTLAEQASQRPARALVGYRREHVERLLAEARAGIAAVNTQKAELSERIERLEADLALRRELAPLLQSTLISAERAADTIRQRARAETDHLLDEAHANARRLTAMARAEAKRLDDGTERLLTSLHTALSILETAPTEANRSLAETEAHAPDQLVGALHEQIRRLSH